MKIGDPQPGFYPGISYPPNPLFIQETFIERSLCDRYYCKYREYNRDQNRSLPDFPGGAVVKNLPANAGHVGSIPGPGRSHMLWSN